MANRHPDLAVSEAEVTIAAAQSILTFIVSNIGTAVVKNDLCKRSLFAQAKLKAMN